MMSWQDVRQEVRGVRPRAAPAGRADFWDNFRAHASLHPQRREPELRPVYGLRWAMVAVAVVMFLAGVSIGVFGGRAEASVGEVLALDVAMPHDAVFIMNDKPSGSTILWIDCPPPAQPERGKK
jgi:hypothetical protein